MASKLLKIETPEACRSFWFAGMVHTHTGQRWCDYTYYNSDDHRQLPREYLWDAYLLVEDDDG